MKTLTGVLTIVIIAAFVSSVMAVPPGKTNEYEGGGAGKVVFDGKKHADQGLKCNDCHPKMFEMKKLTAKITMAELNSGKLCGACHNGTRAFKTSDPASCGRCHKK